MTREVLDFHKVEGLGNDFILVDRRSDRAASAGPGSDRAEALLQDLRRSAAQLCDRRRGVGADGVLLIRAPALPGSEAAMIVINHDGSRPEMCGNGLRCVALYLAAELGPDLTIETDAGPLRARCVVAEENSGEVTIAMGPAREHGAQRPEAGGGRLFYSVSTGNPHAITFVTAAEEPEALARALGPAIEVDPLYPARTNVEFARVEDDGSITLWVWERGCGITQACGTGACATAAAAVRAGLAPAATPLRVRLPGGWLSVEVPPTADASVVMPGPARIVFAGRLELPPR